MDKMIIGFVISLMSEAKPLIKYFNLKKDSSIKNFEIFKSQFFFSDNISNQSTDNQNIESLKICLDICLIVSGVGMIKSSSAASFLLTLLSNQYPVEKIYLINFGICGTNNLDLKIGSMILIHKITNGTTLNDYYPDILFAHDFIEGEIISFTAPVLNNNDLPKNILVDMEAAGFFECSTIFLKKHQIFCIKIISDFLNKEFFSTATISDLISKRLNQLEFFLYKITILQEFEIKTFLEFEDKNLIKSLCHNLRLTTSNYFELIQLAVFYKIKHSNLDVLKDYPPIISKDKFGRRLEYGEIKKLLSN